LLDKLEPIGNDSPVSDQTASEVGHKIANELWWQLNNTQKHDSTLDEVLDQLKIESDNAAAHQELERVRKAYKEVSYTLDRARQDLQLKTDGEQQ
jgi:hypothetical protein